MYVYGNSNPVRYSDPSGLDPVYDGSVRKKIPALDSAMQKARDRLNIKIDEWKRRIDRLKKKKDCTRAERLKILRLEDERKIFLGALDSLNQRFTVVLALQDLATVLARPTDKDYFANTAGAGLRGADNPDVRIFPVSALLTESELANVLIHEAGHLYQRDNPVYGGGHPPAIFDVIDATFQQPEAAHPDTGYWLQEARRRGLVR